MKKHLKKRCFLVFIVVFYIVFIMKQVDGYLPIGTILHNKYKIEEYLSSGGFGNTYIEVDLTSQHVYFYKEGKLVWSSDCVSGKMTKDRYTPSGIYLLDYKTKDRDLKGEKLPNGEYSYVSHVDYWMPFYGGYGFHDASWRSRFGGSIYNYSGSHGCINLPKSKAATLYDLIDKDVPIVIFYRTEIKLRPAEPKKTSDGEGTSSSSKKEESSSKGESSSKAESSSKVESSSKNDKPSSSKEKYSYKNKSK